MVARMSEVAYTGVILCGGVAVADSRLSLLVMFTWYRVQAETPPARLQ